MSDRNYKPPRPSADGPFGSGPFIRFCQSVWDKLFGPESQFINTTTVRVEKTTRGIAFHAATSAPSNSGGLRAYRVKSDGGNYLICRKYSGGTEGESDVKVAKPHSARQPTSETLAGTAFTYTYSTGPDSLNDYRTAVASGISELQVVIPYWTVNGIIQVEPTDYSGVDDGEGRDIKLIEVSARCWAGPAQ